MASNAHIAGDGAMLGYKDASGNVEQGLKEMLDRINGHLDKLHDEMMARSLKRRATFLSECIEAEVVRQADLMLQLSHLDEVLKRRLERMHAERGEALPSTAPESTASHDDELQIEDCVEDQEVDGQTDVRAPSGERFQKDASQDAPSSPKSLIAQLSRMSFSGAQESRKPASADCVRDVDDERGLASESIHTSPVAVVRLEPASLSSDTKTKRATAPSAAGAVAAAAAAVDTSVAGPTKGRSVAAPSSSKAGQAIAVADTAAPAAMAPVAGAPAAPQPAAVAQQAASPQQTYQSLYLNPSNLYALTPHTAGNVANTNTIGYLATEGGGTIDASQLSAALLQNGGQLPVNYCTTATTASAADPGVATNHQVPVAFANATASYVPATLATTAAGPASPYATGAAGPYAAGPGSPYVTGAVSPYAAGVASPYAATNLPQATFTSANGTTNALKPQTLNINGVPVNGYVLNLQDHGGPVAAAGPSGHAAQAATIIPGLKLQQPQAQQQVQPGYIQSLYNNNVQQQQQQQQQQPNYYGYPVYTGYQNYY